jgi:hypothetical protein
MDIVYINKCQYEIQEQVVVLVWYTDPFQALVIIWSKEQNMWSSHHQDSPLHYDLQISHRSRNLPWSQSTMDCWCPDHVSLDHSVHSFLFLSHMELSKPLKNQQQFMLYNLIYTEEIYICYDFSITADCIYDNKYEWM